MIAAPDGRHGAVTIHQDVALYGSRITPGRGVRRQLAPGRVGWLHLAHGAGRVNDTPLTAGGGALSDETSVSVSATAPAAILLFDLP